MVDIKRICELYDNNHSIREIADMMDTYPNKILRELKKVGKQLRSRADSGKIAYDKGRIKPPMLGKKRSQAEKDNIANSQVKRWKDMSDTEIEEFRQGAKDRWNAESVERKIDRQKKAGEALKRASVEGSKVEKFLYQALTRSGYDVIMHKVGLIPGEKFEVDLYLPTLKVAIEIDGPQHFFPIYGETNLHRNIKYDTVKNGALLTRGLCVIRVKYLLKHVSISSNRILYDLIISELSKIENKFPDEGYRLIELEMTND